MYNDFILIEDNIMSILEETRIAVDVYRYTTLEDQELILKTLNQVAADKEIINEKRNKMYYFAKDAFNKRDIRQKLYSSIRSL